MIITLTTDFGTGSPYVAQMKGVILTSAPTVTLVDITHDVPPQDVRQGALVLEDTTPRFPDGTLHLAVVDPGVGTSRKLVYADLGRQRYLAPDNGLLSCVAARASARRLIALTNRRYWLPDVAPTFHGRDILAPVAAHLSRGVPPEQLGEPLDRLASLAWPAVTHAEQCLTGAVLAMDSFGNLITNIRDEDLAAIPDPSAVQVLCSGVTVSGLVRTYGQRPTGSVVALIGSNSRLEVALVGGSAAKRLKAVVGDPVVVTW
jgi:S-adenosyl-L-methionine hydrolase (adenosine-forming)